MRPIVIVVLELWRVEFEVVGFVQVRVRTGRGVVMERFVDVVWIRFCGVSSWSFEASLRAEVLELTGVFEGGVLCIRTRNAMLSLLNGSRLLEKEGKSGRLGKQASERASGMYEMRAKTGKSSKKHRRAKRSSERASERVNKQKRQKSGK